MASVKLFVYVITHGQLTTILSTWRPLALARDVVGKLAKCSGGIVTKKKISLNETTKVCFERTVNKALKFFELRLMNGKKLFRVFLKLLDVCECSRLLVRVLGSLFYHENCLEQVLGNVH